MRTLLATLFILPITLSSFSQTCNVSEFMKKGTEWEISSFNKKGKFTGKTQNKVTEEQHSNGKTTWSLVSESFDKKNNSNGAHGFDLSCQDNKFYINMAQFLPYENREGFREMETEIEANDLFFPTTLNVNSELNDGKISIAAATSGMVVMNLDIFITDRKIEGVETITTEAGTFECLKITQKMKFKNKLMNRTYSTTSWYLPGFGEVRTETFSDNGKLMGSSELSGIKK